MQLEYDGEASVGTLSTDVLTEPLTVNPHKAGEKPLHHPFRILHSVAVRFFSSQNAQMRKT